MSEERRRRSESIFEAIAGMPAEQREAYLEQSCDGDPNLRREVDAMLQATITTYTAQAAGGDTMPGRRIGPWLLKSMLGQGGTGTVYLAVRDDQAFHKQAAIKFIKPGMDTALVMRHFRRERQILARLDHPFISRLLDGGATDEGVPYFVMEYVDGLSLTDYCAKRGLNLRERLRLFREVCAAVQFAHQNLVVHRDLKPGNILVTRDGAPKLLDFGLAKLLVPDLESELTTVGVRMMTPDYASPEQVRGEPVTTATDIYSLGVVLYEVVTGRRPFEVNTGSWAELERRICLTEPPAPGTLVSALRGDLDNIVRKAMRKEPARRYASAEQLGNDIQRHLDGLPVIARQDTLLYRTGKFLRRNRWPAAITAATVCGLIAATTFAVAETRRAHRQIDAVRALAGSMLGDMNEKVRVLPGATNARALMVKTGLDYLDRIGREARGDPAVMWDLARGYTQVATIQAGPDIAEPNLYESANGLESYRQALKLAEQVERARGLDQDLVLLLCRIHIGIGGLTPDQDEAIRHLNECLRLSSLLKPTTGIRWEDHRTPAQFHRDVANLWLALRVQQSDPERALGYLRKTDDSFKFGFSPGILEIRGDLEGAVAMRAIAIRNATFASVPNTFMGQVARWALAAVKLGQAASLGHTFRMNLGRHEEALTLAREALAGIEQALERDPSDLMLQTSRCWILTYLGGILAESDPAASVDFYRRALADPIYPGKGVWVLQVQSARWQIAYPLRKVGKNLEALEQALQSLNERPTPGGYGAAGDAQLDLGRRAAALEQYRASMTAAEKMSGSAPKNAIYRADLAAAYERLGHFYETAPDLPAAREWYAKAHATWASWTQAGLISNSYVVRRERDTASLLARMGAPPLSATH